MSNLERWDEEEKRDLGPNLKNSFGVSVAIHSLILSFFMVRAIFFASDSVDYQAAVRVDFVDLPDKITPEMMQEPPKENKPATPPEPEVKKEPPPPPEPPKPAPVENKNKVNLDKAKAKQKEALDRLKSLSAIEKIEKELKEKEQKSKPASPTFKGNVLSAGTEITGLSKLQHDAYQAEIDKHVKKYWTLPQWLSNANLQARALIRIDERGLVISKEITKSSGNPTYDEIVLETVQKASPFPPPPTKFVNIVGIDGIILGFPE